MKVGKEKSDENFVYVAEFGVRGSLLLLEEDKEVEVKSGQNVSYMAEMGEKCSPFLLGL